MPIEISPIMTVLGLALRCLSNLVFAGRVELAEVWRTESLVTAAVLRVDVTGYPGERDDLVAALRDPGAAVEWNELTGVSGARYRVLSGRLLTVDIEVWESLPAAELEPELVDAVRELVTVPSDPGTEPDQWFEPGNSGPGGGTIPRIRPYIAALPRQVLQPVNHTFTPEVNCGLTDLIGRVAADLGPHEFLMIPADVDDAAVDQVLADHAPAAPPPHRQRRAALGAERPDEPGLSTSDLTARYAGYPGVTVVPGRPPASEAERDRRERWAQYARGQVLEHFAGREFPDVETATDAINADPMADMLEPADVVICARHLVEIAAVRAETHTFRDAILSRLPLVRRRWSTAGIR
jgi:hypothetical protein